MRNLFLPHLSGLELQNRIGVRIEGSRGRSRGNRRSEVSVNTDPNETGQPKRFTVWELHPVTAVLVCTRTNNQCDVNTRSDWQPLK